MANANNPILWLIPQENWSKLPHQFIDLLPEINTLSELKIIIYTLRHTWGYGDISKVISQDEYMNGRKRADGTRIDGGTGLARNSVKSGIKAAVEHGFIVQATDDTDKARIENSYTLSFLGQVSKPDTDDENDLIRGSEIDPPDGQKLTPPKQNRGSKIDRRTKKDNSKGKKTGKKSKPAVGGTDAKADKAKADAKINAMAAVMIKSWISETGAVKPDAQALYNKTAVGLVNNGVTVANVIDYIRHLKTQDFWRGKTPSFDYIATNIKGWLDDKAKPTNDPKRFGEQHTTDTADYSQDELIETGKAQVRLLYDPSKGSFIEHLNKIIAQDNHLSEPARLLLEDEKQHG